jgi:predicted amino acid-binding ACT domain protein
MTVTGADRVGIIAKLATVDLQKIRSRPDRLAGQMSLNITFQDESIFKAMHRV